MKIVDSVEELIGNTAIIEVEKNIYGKCEFLNPFGSVKDRIALNMVQAGIEAGNIDTSSTIIEPTSGNTGIALAAICAQKGLKLILTMPESMSIERRKLLLAMGAKLELTPANKGMQGAIEKAKQLQKQIDNSFIIDQFSNPANPQAHVRTTAVEILEQVPNIDVFVAGVGTAGTISGVASVLKKHNPAIEIYAVEPKSSAVLSANNPGAHKIQGIGAGFIPKNYNTLLVDKILQVSDTDAIACARELIAQKSLLVGISSGANVYAAREVAKKDPTKKIVTILCDSAMRYLSTDLFA
ncbi:MAG: cysteine synthase A [Campylobacterota bacterium]